MVEDRVADGERIAELLASELSGRESGALADLALADVDEDATPSPAGTRAYAVTYREAVVAEVTLYPERVLLSVRAPADPEAVAAAVSGPHLAVEGSAQADGVALAVASGAAVKRAVDALLAGLPG